MLHQDDSVLDYFLKTDAVRDIAENRVFLVLGRKLREDCDRAPSSWQDTGGQTRGQALAGQDIVLIGQAGNSQIQG